MTARTHDAVASEDADILRGAVLCALLMSAAVSITAIQPAIRVAVALLGGRALLASRTNGDGTRRPTDWRTIVYIGALWATTFSPIALFGNPDAARSSAVAAVVVLLLARLSVRATLAVAITLLVAAMPASALSPHTGYAGVVEYAMGASWPRGWDNVTTSVALFTVGSVWQKSNEAGTRVLRLPARLLALCAPIAALGRMPRMVLLGYSVVVIALHSIAAN